MVKNVSERYKLLTGGFKVICELQSIFEALQWAHSLHSQHLRSWWRGAAPYSQSAKAESWSEGWGGEREPESCVERRNNSVWAEGEALFAIFTPHTFSRKIPLALLSRAHAPPSLAALWAWYDHSLDKHSSTMRCQKRFFSFFSNKAQEMPLVSGFWWELWVCFQFGVIPGTHRFLSKNRQRRKSMVRKERGGRRRRRRGKEGGRGVWLMSTRCLTFGGSHILWSFSWCMICARTYVRGDAWAPFTCRGNGKKNKSAGTQYRNFRWQSAVVIYWFYPFFIGEKTRFVPKSWRMSVRDKAELHFDDVFDTVKMYEV